MPPGGGEAFPGKTAIRNVRVKSRTLQMWVRFCVSPFPLARTTTLFLFINLRTSLSPYSSHFTHFHNRASPPSPTPPSHETPPGVSRLQSAQSLGRRRSAPVLGRKNAEILSRGGRGHVRVILPVLRRLARRCDGDRGKGAGTARPHESLLQAEAPGDEPSPPPFSIGRWSSRCCSARRRPWSLRVPSAGWKAESGTRDTGKALPRIRSSAR